MLEYLLTTPNNDVFIPPTGQSTVFRTNTDFIIPEGVYEVSLCMIGSGGGGGAGLDGGPTDSSLIRGGSAGAPGGLFYINKLKVLPGYVLRFEFGSPGIGASHSGGTGGTSGNSYFYINSVLKITIPGSPGGRGGNRTGTNVIGVGNNRSVIESPIDADNVVMLTSRSLNNTSHIGGDSRSSSLGLSGSADYTTDASILNGRGGRGGATYTGIGTSKFTAGKNGEIGGARVIWGEGRFFPSTLVFDM